MHSPGALSFCGGRAAETAGTNAGNYRLGPGLERARSEEQVQQKVKEVFLHASPSGPS